VISVLRFRPVDVVAFEQDVRAALDVIASCPGFVRATLGCATDDPQAWVLMTEWESVGAFRRGLGGTAVRMVAMPLLMTAIDEPSAYEQLVVVDSSGAVSERASDRSVDWRP
jgi:heme-degrading monooxygenase HmoA